MHITFFIISRAPKQHPRTHTHKRTHGQAHMITPPQTHRHTAEPDTQSLPEWSSVHNGMKEGGSKSAHQADPDVVEQHVESSVSASACYPVFCY